MVKPHKVRSILGNLRNYRGKLGILAALPAADFLNDFTDDSVIQRIVQENLVDLDRFVELITRYLSQGE